MKNGIPVQNLPNETREDAILYGGHGYYSDYYPGYYGHQYPGYYSNEKKEDNTSATQKDENEA